jgi:aldehyde:ferredoxin oxidoreductase
MPHWDQMLDNYYSKMGWNPKNGVPTEETLKKLGIGEIWNDLSSL